MPRSSGHKRKAKNAGVGIDFKKARHKVGKKLPKAQNETNTDFKSKKINLPGQNVGEEKGNAVTNRNLTLKELLVQSGHHSPKVRLEALQGLMELFGPHPEGIRQQTGPLLEKLADRISDEDRAVRAALTRLLSQRVLPRLHGGLLTPFLPLLMAHVCSAMTHLDGRIREDALGFLEGLMSAAPVEVTAQYLEPSLQHYSNLLSPTTRSRSISSQAVASLLQVLVSLRRFLEAADPQNGGGVSTTNATRLASGSEPLLSSRRAWVPLMAIAQASKALAKHSSKAAGESQDKPRKAPRELMSRVLDAWGECSPSTAEENEEPSAVHAMEACLQNLCLLLPIVNSQGCTTGDISDCKAEILRRVGPHIPMRATAVRLPQAMQQAIVQFNLTGMRLFALLLEGDDKGKSTGVQPAAEGKIEAAWNSRLLEYVSAVLQRGEVLPPDSEFGCSLRQPPVPPETYLEVLAGVEILLLRVPVWRRGELLSAISSLYSRSPAKSATKAACLKLMALMLSSPTKFLQIHEGQEPTAPAKEVVSWLQGLPKLLWELGSNRPETSHAALQVLFNAARFAPPGGCFEEVLQKLQPSLALFYCAALPNGKREAALSQSRQGGEERLLSPLSKLPQKSQTLAVDLLYYLPDLDSALLKSAGQLCTSTLLPEGCSSRLASVVVSKLLHDIDHTRMIDFLLEVLLGSGSSATPAARHKGMAAQAARDLVFAESDGASVLTVAEERLLEACSPISTSTSSVGAMMAVTALVKAASSKRPKEANESYTLISEEIQQRGDLPRPAGDGCMPQRLLAALPGILCRHVVTGSRPSGRESLSQSDAFSVAGQLLEALPECIPTTVSLLPSAASQQPKGNGWSCHGDQEINGLATNAAADSQSAAQMTAAAEFLLYVLRSASLLPLLADFQSELQGAAEELRRLAEGLGCASEEVQHCNATCKQLRSMLMRFLGPNIEGSKAL